MRSLLVLIVFTVFLGLSDASINAQDLTGDMRALQGKWRVSFVDDRSIVLEFKNNTITHTSHSPLGSRPPAIGSFEIDDTQDPKHMTWKDVEFPGRKLEVNRCIYELHGDTLLLIGGISDRPKTFISGPGKPHITWILKREK